MAAGAPEFSGAVRTFKIILILFLLLCIWVGLLFMYGRTQLEPVSATHGKPVSIVVSKGESLDAVTTDLSNHGLIRSTFWFSLFARFKGLDKDLSPGTFSFDSGMGASAIIAQLEGSPEANQITLTIPEGLTIDQMAQRIADMHIGITKQQYLDAVNKDTYNAPFLSMRPAGDTSMEGFLFPDTYKFDPGTTAHTIVQLQLDAFNAKVMPLIGKDQDAYSKLIIASILEREAKFGDDFPKVASVIDNRLNAGMNLQIDAIVLYGLNKVGQQMSAADQTVDTPYNSYLYSGLPPTPISNPGVETIQAAINPAQTNYYFYVSDGCGHNHYSETEAEHEQQVNQYIGTPCSG